MGLSTFIEGQCEEGKPALPLLDDVGSVTCLFDDGESTSVALDGEGEAPSFCQQDASSFRQQDVSPTSDASVPVPLQLFLVSLLQCD